jgi:hypothetical protein
VKKDTSTVNKLEEQTLTARVTAQISSLAMPVILISKNKYKLKKGVK